MELEGRRVFVTGGAGFIGSHLVDRLVGITRETIVFDNLSTGSLENLKHNMRKANLRFIHGDLLNPKEVSRALNDCSIVFHLAANPEVRVGAENTRIDFEQNLVATRNLLEAMRESKNARNMIFSSTSTVYGEASQLPTTEEYAPLLPISLYGASKLGCEALIAAYSHLFKIRTVIYRFANIVGSRSKHGVIYDFIEKLRNITSRLEILGDGTQAKSYMHIQDCVDAFLYGCEHAKSQVEIFNLGSEDRIDVKAIAELVTEEMGLENVEFKLLGGPEGRGWLGDVKNMQLNILKIKKLGWKPKYNSSQAVKLAAQEVLEETREK